MSSGKKVFLNVCYDRYSSAVIVGNLVQKLIICKTKIKFCISVKLIQEIKTGTEIC